METKVLLERLSDKMRDLSVTADWYDNMHAHGLSELYRFAQKTVGDFIDLVRKKKCKNVEDAHAFLCIVQHSLFNDYKYYQEDHFDHLAELSVFGYRTLGDLENIINSIKSRPNNQ